MRPELVVGAILALIPPVVLPWFYIHCARPNLAMAGCRPLGFWLVLVATVVAVLAGITRVVDIFVHFPPTIDSALDWAWEAQFVGLVPLLAYLWPKAVVLLTGGPDPEVPARYLLTRAVVWWARDDWSVERAGGVVRWLLKELEALPIRFRTSAVEAWIRDVTAIRDDWTAGRMDETKSGIQSMYRGLLAVKPVEPTFKLR